MLSHASELSDHVATLLGAMGRFPDTLSSMVTDRSAQAAAFYRTELRRVATVLVLALTAAFFACAAAGFAAFSITVAYWAVIRC